MESKQKPELIAALDLNNKDEVYGLLSKLGDSVLWYKVGPVLFTKYGPEIIKIVKYSGGGVKKVMLDLKFHDISNTVGKSCKAAAELGVDMLTVHLSGGKAMLKAAVDSGVNILGISVLTSINDDILNEELNIDDTVPNRVLDLLELGIQSGIHGIVCSAEETSHVKDYAGSNLAIINPGIRLAGDSKDDQKRLATPAFASKNGADFIVMGRGIYESPNPAEAVKKIMENMNE